MTRVRFIPVGLMAALLAVASTARAQDVEGDANVEPVDWEPVITRFFIKPRFKTVSPVQLKLDKKAALPGARAAWLEIKPLIAIPAGAIPEDAGVVGGWQLEKESGQSENIAPFLDVTSKDKTILTMLKDEPWQLIVGFDVIMSMDPARKEQVLKDYFKVMEMEVTKAIAISDDPKQFRAAAPAGAKPEGNFIEVTKQANPFGAEWYATIGGKTVSCDESIARKEGVAEFRFRATVSGRFSSLEKEQVKSVQGAIRVAFVGQAIEVRILNFKTSRGGSSATPTPKK
jgi:hypothetical protein